MGILSTIGGRIVAKSVIDVARRIARDLAKFKEGYIAGYSDARNGKSPKYK